MSNGHDHSARKQVWRDNWTQHDKIVDIEHTGGDSSSLVRFNGYFVVTQMVKLGNFEALGVLSRSMICMGRGIRSRQAVIGITFWTLNPRASSSF
jgi:hypothetical protein